MSIEVWAILTTTGHVIKFSIDTCECFYFFGFRHEHVVVALPMELSLEGVDGVAGAAAASPEVDVGCDDASAASHSARSWTHSSSAPGGKTKEHNS